jgi:WD repeat-containing protein 35
MTTPITPDQLRTLILISRFSSPAESVKDEERWIKKIPLMALIGRGVKSNVFTEYDIAPSLIEYHGDTQFANISKEGEDDISDLRTIKLVERLKLATKHHYYVSAYRITQTGMDFIKDADQAHHRAIDDLLRCAKCGDQVEVITKSDNPYLRCRKCDAEEELHFLDIEEVPYVTSPVFPEIWLPK